jgi:hypothetical protein
MSIPVYPVEDFDRGSQLLRQLGSFWFNVFDDRATIKSYLRASGNEHGQTYLDFLETVSSLSRFTVPVFHVENWHLLTVKFSDANSTASIYQAGDLVYGSQSGVVTGRPAGFIQTYAGMDRPDQLRVQLPGDLADIPRTLQNLILFPSLILVNGVDFDVDKERLILRFLKNPFDNVLVPKRDIVDSTGAVVDQEIALWIYKGDFDLEHVYVHFGYAIGVKLQSSQFYKDLLNAFWDMHVLGPSRRALELMLSALSGVALGRDPVEIVEVVQVEETSQLIVTSSQVYRVPLTSTVIVSVGQEIFQGDPLTDAFSIVELSGHDPDYDALPVLAMSKHFLSGGFFSEISFKNVKGDIQFMGNDEDGKAIIRLEATGFSSDLEKFWDLVHQRGKAAGRTLANLLDIRADPVGEPTAANLPSELNPLRFVLENVLRNNLFLIRLKITSFDPKAPGLALLRLLRLVVPPHTTYVICVDVSVPEETVDLSVVGGDDEAGAEESLDPLLATDEIEDKMDEVNEAVVGDPSYGDEQVLIRAVAEDCN